MSEIQEALDQIAVIGMAGRFPGARDVAQFWDNLTHGREGIVRLSMDELVSSGVDPALAGRDEYVPAKGVLDGADTFDAGFFGYSPREAEILDPQHRVFLECAWEAIEDAGCVPTEFEGRIGVFAGAALNTYLLFNVMANRRVSESVGPYQTLLASDKDFLATRAAYKLGLRGPAITVQTACSTSLTAVHLACQSLLNGECDIALAGGVTVSSPLKQGYAYEPGGIASPDGHCRPFDAQAAGTVAGNGVGIVVLRRLSDARDSGDAVAAVILGTAVNNDGSLKAGYTAPSVDGQAAVISEALAVAGVGAESIGYVETHGTATALGDPIEIAALTRAFREYTDEIGCCAIGSVKSNVGHLDAASGVTGLIKTVLMLQHGAIPPSLHFTEANPELKLETSPFQVAGELRPWPRGDTPRRAGVSSFGIGGTNVHVVLQEAPGEPARPDRGDATDRPVLLPLSAKSPDALADSARRLADHLDAYPEADLAAVAHTLAARRRAFEFRRAVVCRGREEAVSALRRVRPADAVAAAERQPRVAFLFPGQGAQYVGMARDLYRHEPVFAAHLDRCAALFAAELGVDLRELLFAGPQGAEAAAERLAQTQITQPVMFLVEYALAQLWLARGVRPTAMAGHSIGEYVAACLAGVFSLEDAVRLVAARGRLVRSMPPGAMLSVFLPEAQVTPWLDEPLSDSALSGGEPGDGGLSLSAVNSTGLCVVSGPHEAVDRLSRRLADAGISCRRLHTSHAFHSASMDAAVEPLTALVRTLARHAPSIPFCSNLTGTWITDEQATSAEYWGRHLRMPVRFADAAQALLSERSMVFVEVGPGHTLTNFVRSHAAWDERHTAVTSLRHPHETEDDRVHLLRALAGLWSAGAAVDRGVLDPGANLGVLRLPTYPFQRQRYWVTPDAGAPAAAAAPQPAADAWFYSPGWRRLPPPGYAGIADPAEPAAGAGVPLWVLLGDHAGLPGALARRLTGAGAAVVPVTTGAVFDDLGDGSWSADPADRDQLARLLTGLVERGPAGLRIVHAVSLDTDPAPGLDEDRLRRARRAGFDSLLALAQAIGQVRPAMPVSIDVLCRGVHEVTGDEPLQPENATLTGACTVIPQELSGVRCRLLDVTGVDPRDPGRAAVDAVERMLTRPTDQRVLALRGRHWWYRDFDAVPMPVGTVAAPTPADALPVPVGTGGAPRLRDHGVYLITGGLGGIGLALAEHLADRMDSPVLALLGRSAFPPEGEWDAWLAGHPAQDPTSARIARLRRLRERGARIVLCRADVTDPEQTTAQVRRLREEFGAIHGVIHAAGLPGAGMIAGKTAADVERVFDPKVRGTVVLDEACAGEPLDFFLLCSSVTSTLGGTGQSDYCAANAFLDTFAHWKRRQGAAGVTALDWGRWEGVGMAAGLDTGGVADPAGESTGHPLLRRVASSARGQTYATRFTTADSWIVDDHRLMGHGLVPGTAYLELVRSALAGRAGDRVIELHDVLFIAPVVVPDGQARTVYTTLDERDGRVSFTVRSRDEVDGSWRDNAAGWASFAPRGEQPVRDLAEVRAGCRVREVFDSEQEILRRARAERWTDGPLQFRVGPRWRVLSRLELGEGQLLATLRLPEEFRADLDEYPLHPALLDMAVGIFRLDAEEANYLPLSYGTLRVLRPLTGTTYCHSWLRPIGDGSGETLTCDLELLDPDGRVLVEISGYSVKRINDVPGLMAQITRSVRAAGTPSGAGAGGDAGGDAGRDAAGEAAHGAAVPGILQTLMRGMSEQDALGAFARVLAAPDLPAQLVVGPGDFARLRELARSVTPEVLAQELAEVAPPDSHPRPELDTPYVAPRTDEERAVAAVWQEVLGVEPVGVDDDFFALGGHSLAAVQISTRIRSQLGAEFDLKNFFDTPTVAHLAALLAARAGSAARDAIEVIDRGAGDIELDGLDGLSDDEVDARLWELLAQDSGELR
jgi:phthiocerol/phenolphthiocerol synthesis type-I polyketide synthase E